MELKKFSQDIPGFGNLVLALDWQAVEQTLVERASGPERDIQLYRAEELVQRCLDLSVTVMGLLIWQALNQDSVGKVHYAFKRVTNRLEDLHLELERLAGFMEKPREWWEYFGEG